MKYRILLIILLALAGSGGFAKSEVDSCPIPQKTSRLKFKPPYRTDRKVKYSGLLAVLLFVILLTGIPVFTHLFRLWFGWPVWLSVLIAFYATYLVMLIVNMAIILR